MWAFFVGANRLGAGITPEQNERCLSQPKALRTEFVRLKHLHSLQQMQAVPFLIPEITA